MRDSNRVAGVLRRLLQLDDGGVDRVHLRRDMQALSPDELQELWAAVQLAARIEAEAAEAAAARPTRPPQSKAA